MAECKKCIHEVVCESAKACDGRVSGCKHFNGWISVKERLPDLELAEAKSNDCDSYVCITAKRGFANKDQIFIIKAWYYGDRFENDDGIDITDDVTHWMPLPEPPKGE